MPGAQGTGAAWVGNKCSGGRLRCYHYNAASCRCDRLEAAGVVPGGGNQPRTSLGAVGPPLSFIERQDVRKHQWSDPPDDV